jgi:NADH-quinone oxidoreductase subunit E
MISSQNEKILNRYPDAKRENLIPLLQEIQELHGYVSKETIMEIGTHLQLPASKIYGVATFYNQFRFNPPGKYHIQICRGTACHVKGSSNVLDILQRELKITAGQTSRDGLFSIEVVACLGACGLAPVISINGEFHANVTNKKLQLLVKQIRAKDKDNV